MQVDTPFKHMLFTTVNVKVDKPAPSSGTGFLFNASRGGQELPVLVTNKHVVEAATLGGIQLIGSDDGGATPKLGHPVEVRYQGFADVFTSHPDPNVDVVAMFFGPTLNQLTAAGRGVFIRVIDSDLCPKPAQLRDLDAVETVTFIGYPNGLYDRANYTPIVRQGITATPIELDWSGTPCFLIDASVFPGSSGSPVFLVQQGMYREGNSTVLGGGVRIFFLGVVSAVMVQADTGALVTATSGNPIVAFKQIIDLGIVYKWRAVEETIDALCCEHGVDRGAALAVSAQETATREPEDISEVETGA